MGFFSLIKKIFTGESAEEKALDEARARHGIVLDAATKAEGDKPMSEEQRFAENYDPWDDIRNYRSNFFIGGWAARKFHIVGEDKVKRQLQELEKKREAEAKGKDVDLLEKEKGEKK